jgi:hypothetical protein
VPQYATQQHASGGAAKTSAGGGIDLKTLLVTAVSSAAAAYACSQVWAPGTLAAAAFTPVLVAVIREGLSKSTEVVTRAVPVRGVVRSARPEGPQPLDPDAPADDVSATAPAAPLYAEDPAYRVAQPGEIVYHGARRRGWRVAIVTGLLGFLVCAVVFTVPELVTGGSAAGGGRDTTLFGGKKRQGAAPAVTTTTPTTTTTTVTVPPANTVTVPPPAVTTPEPATTTPGPEEGTPTTTTPPTTTPVAPGAPPPAAPPG